MVCQWVPSMCEYKGIVCDRRRRAEEATYLAKNPELRRKLERKEEEREITQEELIKFEQEMMEDV